MKDKRKIISTGITLILVVIFFFSLYKLITRYVEYNKGLNSYDDAVNIAGIENIPLESTEKNLKPGELPKVSIKNLEKLNLGLLQEENEDVMGWILIPKTKISYPILRGKDNDYYLTHTWDKEYNWMGSIFMEIRSAEDFSDFNSIIYGHNLRNTSMFSTLLNYKEQEYFDEHPSIYLVTDRGVDKYEIFAAYEADVLGPVFDFHINDKVKKNALIQTSVSQSAIDTGIIPKTKDHILTLSTCTGNGHDTRWIVQGVRVKKGTKREALKK